MIIVYSNTARMSLLDLVLNDESIKNVTGLNAGEEKSECCEKTLMIIRQCFVGPLLEANVVNHLQ